MENGPLLQIGGKRSPRHFPRTRYLRFRHQEGPMGVDSQATDHLLLGVPLPHGTFARTNLEAEERCVTALSSLVKRLSEKRCLSVRPPIDGSSPASRYTYSSCNWCISSERQCHPLSRPVGQLQIITWARKCAAADISILQLVRLVNDAQNPALRNILLLRLVHYQHGTSSALLELELGLEGGRSQVEGEDIWRDRNLSPFDVNRGHDHVFLDCTLYWLAGWMRQIDYQALLLQ